MWAVLTQHREPWVLSPKTSMVEIEAGQSRVRVILGYIRSLRPAWAM